MEKRILECGDKSRAARGSRHRFLSAPRAEAPLLKKRRRAEYRLPPHSRFFASLTEFSPRAARPVKQTLDPPGASRAAPLEN